MAVWGQPLILLGFCLCGSGPGSPQILAVWIRVWFSAGSVCVDQSPVLLRCCLCGSESGSPRVLSVWIRTQFSSCSVCVNQDPVLLRFCLCGFDLLFLKSVCLGQGPGLPQALSVSMVQGWFWSGSSAQCRQCGGPQLSHPEPRGCGAVSTFAGRQSVLQARALRCRLVWLSLEQRTDSQCVLPSGCWGLVS